MFATVRIYRMGAGSVDEAAHIVDEQLADRMAEQPGFVGYELFDAGEGRIVTVTMFQDREGVERSTEMAAEFVRSSLTDFQLERMDVLPGEVLVSRARSEMLEPTHH